MQPEPVASPLIDDSPVVRMVGAGREHVVPALTGLLVARGNLSKRLGFLHKMRAPWTLILAEINNLS
eukprot:3162973-Pleurochrysis_carterae.AAC.2